MEAEHPASVKLKKSQATIPIVAFLTCSRTIPSMTVTEFIPETLSERAIYKYNSHPFIVISLFSCRRERVYIYISFSPCHSLRVKSHPMSIPRPLMLALTPAPLSSRLARQRPLSILFMQPFLPPKHDILSLIQRV